MIENALFHGTLQTVWDRCLQQQICVVACVPGSLKQRVVYGSGYQIGSLRIKTFAPNTSILIFANGKIKCSGSYKEYNKDVMTESTFIVNLVRPILNNVQVTFDDCHLSIRLLNAGFTLDGMNERKYFKLCNEIKNHYDHVVLPNTTHSRGRFCAMKIYVEKRQPGPSLHFDHKGKVQVFACKSVDAIHEHVQRLVQVVHQII